MAKLRVTQRRSVIDRPRDQKDTVRRLGLKRINDSVIKEDRPEIRGMIAKVRHLVDVEEDANEVPAAEGRRRRRRTEDVNKGVQGGSGPSEAKGSADPLAEGRRRRRRTEDVKQA
jgi:large subunit ribosomal protein L30